MEGMWVPQIHWGELVLRAVLVYFFLLILLRLTGKRQVGQLAPFDLILLLVLSNAVQNAMNGGDNSYTAGILSAGTLVGVNYLVSFGTFRWKWFSWLIEGKPTILIHNGKVDEKAMRHEQMTHHELMAALRAEGLTSIEQVHVAILENTGRISVLPYRNDPPRHSTAGSPPEGIQERPT
jgi:uncharacterized membrane protein YcaP (DUF421 family)